MTGSLLSVEAASVNAGRAALLDAISIELNAGEVLAVLGANGAGKSTLLNALSGDQSLSAGRVLLRGVSLDRYSAQALADIRAVNAIEPPLAFALPVADAVALGRPFAPLDDAALNEALDACHAGAWRERDASTLSSGELLRVQLARSRYQLHGVRDGLWLLDEPLSHLDPAQRQFVLRLLRSSASELGWGVVFSTHDPRDAAAIADQVLLLGKGRALAYGAPDAVLSAQNLHACYDIEIA